MHVETPSELKAIFWIFIIFELFTRCTIYTWRAIHRRQYRKFLNLYNFRFTVSNKGNFLNFYNFRTVHTLYNLYMEITSLGRARDGRAIRPLLRPAPKSHRLVVSVVLRLSFLSSLCSWWPKDSADSHLLRRRRFVLLDSPLRSLFSPLDVHRNFLWWPWRSICLLTRTGKLRPTVSFIRVFILAGSFLADFELSSNPPVQIYIRIL